MSVDHCEFLLRDWLVQPGLNAVTRNGATVHLEPKVMELLVCLAAHGGQVVSKEDIMRAVWPDTFVGDQALTNAIWQLRQALGNGGGRSEIVETIPKRGYRLVPPIRPAVDAGPAPAEAEKPRTSSRWRVLLAAGIVLAAGVTVATIWKVRHQAGRFSAGASVVLAGFENRTGDAAFDGILHDALSINLSESPFLVVFPEVQARDRLQTMRHAADEPITAELGRQVCLREGLNAVVTGSITQLGTDYVITLQALDCSSGRTLAQTQSETTRKEHVLNALGEAGSELRRQVGESLQSVQAYATPLPLATTASLEALQAYSAGLAAKDGKAAAEFCERATQIDPAFALPYVRLAELYRGWGADEPGRAYLEKAFALKQRASQVERLEITTGYYLYRGEVEKAIAAAELLAKQYPHATAGPGALVGAYALLGDSRKMLEAAAELARRAPGDRVAHWDLARAHERLGQLAEARAVCEASMARQLDHPNCRVELYRMAFRRGDGNAMRLYRDSLRSTSQDSLILLAESETEAYAGKLRMARALSRQAVAAALAHAADKNNIAAEFAARQAYAEAETGNCSAALAAMRQAPPATGYYALSGKAVVLARCGNAAGARRVMAELEGRFPVHVVVQRVSLPAIEAAMALSRGDPQAAVRALDGSLDYHGTFAVPPYTTMYLRATAHLRLKQAAEAAAEFQKILDYAGWDLTSPLLPLSHLGLARAYARSGEWHKSRGEYETFLALWKDGDDEIPILKQARAEYAGLLRMTH